MAPKPRKDSAAPVPPEDLTQDVLLVVSVPKVQLQLGLHASPALQHAEPLQDASAAPALHVELHHSASAGAVVTAALVLSPDFVLAPNIEHRFRHKKGPDIIDRLINATLELRVCNSSTKVVLAAAPVDLLAFGLGANAIEDDALQLQPAMTDEPFKVRPDRPANRPSSDSILVWSNERARLVGSGGACIGIALWHPG